MSYHITDLGRTIQRFRSEYEAATPPAATSRAAATPAGNHATTHRARRGQDHELGRMAQAYEDMHEQDFQRELSGGIFMTICALCFLLAAGFAIAAPYILRLLFALFDLLAAMI